MASTDARAVPKKNVAFRAYFPILNLSGDFVSGATGLDSEVSIDGGNFADATSEATEIQSTGLYFLDLTSGEMNGDAIVVQVKTTTANAKTTPLFFYPQEAGDILATTEAINASVITATSIATDAITAAKIAADAIGASEIADGAIDAATFAAGAINAAAIATDAITAAKIAADAIGASELAADAVTEIQAAVAAGAVASVTGNVGGNVTGSVGSVATGGITAASIAADAIGASELAADAVTEIQSGLATSSSLSTAQTAITAIKAKTDNLPASPAAVGSAMTVDLTQALNKTPTADTMGDALMAAVAQGFGKWTLVGTTLTLYAHDGTSVVRTFTLDSATTPTTRT